jgi:ankyrin repeat protein/ubiquitin-protein ligase
MAKFHLDTICQQDTIRALRQQLESLPEDLDSFYEDQLSRILGSRNPLRDRAKHLLTWIHTATRHLTYLEMQLALSVNPNDSFLDTEALCDLETIVASCAGVVVIDAESQHIRFVHATFQEYITKANNRDLSFYSESQISTVCITYAMFTEFASGRCLSDEAMIARLDQYPLLIYVALNWHKHLRKTVDPGLDLVSKATLLLKHEGCRNTLAQAMFLPPGRFEGFSSTYPATPSALWMAAYCGLDGICLALLEENHFVDEEIQPDGSTALCAAATAGNISTVELLMDASANIQKQSNRSPLIEASKQSHVEIVHFLLTRGASPTQAGRDGRTALHAAVVGDFEAVVALLITQEPDISAYSQNTKWTPQHSAASVGAIKSLMLLLKSSMISLDPQTFDGETPLHLAVEHQRFETVQILLEAGADLLCQNRFGHIALHIAATKNAADICRLLLRRNQKITHSMLKMQDHSGQTVIHKAAERGAVAVIELLLSEEINYFTTDVAGYQPLHLAAENGHKDIVALLLSKGADYTSVTRRGLSCQQLAVARGHIDIVELLHKLTLKPTRHDSHLDSEMRQDQLSSPLDEGSNDKHQILSTKTQPNETGQQSTVPTVSAEASGERGQITLAKVLKTLRAPFESATTESTQTDLLSQPIAGRSKGFLKRLRLEITDVERSGNKFSLSPLTDDLLDWEAKLPGPANSDYAGGFFRVEINFTDNYPFTPPNIFFVTKIFHTNVHDSGHISLNLFASNPSMSKLKKPRQISSSSFGGATQWSPALTILKCTSSLWLYRKQY